MDTSNNIKKHYTLFIRPADIILIIILTTISLSGFILQKGLTQQGKFYIVEINGKMLYRLLLATDTLFTIRGRTGDITIEAKNSRVRISESSCPLKLCVKTGWINKPGESIICVPNKLAIHIQGSNKGVVDAVTE